MTGSHNTMSQYQHLHHCPSPLGQLFFHESVSTRDALVILFVFKLNVCNAVHSTVVDRV